MAEWEEKLGAILNDPQAMGQIMSLARSLGGGQGPEDARSGGPETLPEAVAPPEPESASVGGGPELDPRLARVGMRALAAYRSQDNAQAALLQALRPFVRPQRYAKVDQAVRIAKLSKVIRAALDALQEGEE